MKKLLVLSFLVMICLSWLVIPLFAGGQKEASEAGVRKKIYFASGEDSPSQVALFKQLEKEYEALYPDRDVIYERLVTDMAPLFAASIAADVPKGIYHLGTSIVLEFADRGVFLPINDVVDNIGREDFNTWAVMTFSGQDLAVAYAGSMRVLLYRKDLLEQAGLEVPKNHSEFTNAAKRLTQDNNGDGVIDIYGIGLPGGQSMATTWYANEFLWQNGAQVFDKDLNITLDQPAALEAIDTYVKLLENGPPGASTWTWSEHREAYSTGRVAMAIMGGREPSKIGMSIPDIAKVTELAPLPYNKVNANTGGADVYVLAKTCTTIKETKEFLEWILTGDRAIRFYSAVPGHLIPILKSQGRELTSFTPDDPDTAKYIKDFRRWLDVIFNECAPYAIDMATQEGSIQGDRYVPTNVSLPGELATRMYGEPALLSEVIYKIAWEDWSVKDAVDWGVKELEKVKKEIE